MNNRNKIIIASIAFAVVIGGTLILDGASKTSTKTPPKIPTSNTYQGFIKDNQGLIEFTDKDVKSYPTVCKDSVKLAAGVHTYYSLSDDTIEDWFDKIKPKEGNKVLLAYYSPGEKIGKTEIAEGWYLYPKGPYTSKDVHEIAKNDIDTFEIPAKRAVHVISMNDSVFCNAKNVRTSADHISKFETDDLQEVSEGWILVPTTLPYKDSIKELEKDFNIKSAWSTYKGAKKGEEQYKEVDLDDLKLPDHALPMSWFYVENKDKTVKKVVKKADPKKVDPKKTDPKNDTSLVMGVHDFPTLTLDAVKGDTVLVPEEDNLKDYKANSKVSYVAALIVKVDKTESTVEVNKGEYKVNNSLIIPLQSNVVAAKGDIVITPYFDEGYVFKAIISKPGKSPSAYLFGGDETAEVKLIPGAFNIIKGIFESGATVAVKTGTKYTQALIINQTKDKALVYSLKTYTLEAVNKKDLIVASPNIDVRPGKVLFVPVEGVYTQAVIKTIDATKGQVTAEYTAGKEKKKSNFYLGDLLTPSAFK